MWSSLMLVLKYTKGLYDNQEQRDVVEIPSPVILEGLKKFEKEEPGVDSDEKILEHPEAKQSSIVPVGDDMWEKVQQSEQQF